MLTPARWSRAGVSLRGPELVFRDLLYLIFEIHAMTLLLNGDLVCFHVMANVTTFPKYCAMADIWNNKY
jgi:hypothetical protein